MKVAQFLWNVDIACVYSHLDNPKFKKQLDEALERRIPYMIVFGQDELVAKTVKVKDMKSKTEETVSISEGGKQLIQLLNSRGCKNLMDMSDLFQKQLSLEH